MWKDINAPAAGLMDSCQDEVNPRGMTLCIPVCSLRPPSIESTELVLSQHVLKSGLIACTAAASLCHMRRLQTGVPSGGPC